MESPSTHCHHLKNKNCKGINWKGDHHFAKSIGLEIRSSYKPKLKIVEWTKPEVGWIKINTDGASKGNPGVAGEGGIPRNEEGAVIFAFYEKLGESDNTFAEVFSLFKALQICQIEVSVSVSNLDVAVGVCLCFNSDVTVSVLMFQS
ncbi:putative ribonuclease H protein [Sesamum angolense]|uniref:Ribonuclease H protein n=1 Tax=Sesamum angolense TaxID=2727404 RepID=A0AAE1TA06_9LAMI|nr:putative ribonuclease H protein [Sesamum angolense]